MDKFTKEDIDFYLHEGVKSLSKEYIMAVIFDKTIQRNWRPQIGDLIIGCTGNIFSITNSFHYNEAVGGWHYFFGGGLCVRGSGTFTDETYSSVMTKDGIEYDINGKPKEYSRYSKKSAFRFIPYPHELSDEKWREYFPLFQRKFKVLHIKPELDTSFLDQFKNK